MARTTLKTPFQRILTIIACLILLVSGCLQYPPGKLTGDKPYLSEIKKLVVIGFRPALLPGEPPGISRSPISGAVFAAEPVSQTIADTLTARLFLELSAYERVEFISPGEAKGVFSRLLSSGVFLEDIEICRQIGQAFSADGVLAGHIYRWRERQGTDYGVDQPASVAFDLHLIRTEDGRTLWKGRFDKTQQSLSENLFDMQTFIKSKGKWMKAQQMGYYGLDEILEDLTTGETPKKD